MDCTCPAETTSLYGKEWNFGESLGIIIASILGGVVAYGLIMGLGWLIWWLACKLYGYCKFGKFADEVMEIAYDYGWGSKEYKQKLEEIAEAEAANKVVKVAPDPVQVV